MYNGCTFVQCTRTCTAVHVRVSYEPSTRNVEFCLPAESTTVAVLFLQKVVTRLQKLKHCEAASENSFAVLTRVFSIFLSRCPHARLCFRSGFERRIQLRVVIQTLATSCQLPFHREHSWNKGTSFEKSLELIF